jgi:PEGA domain-containing protein
MKRNRFLGFRFHSLPLRSFVALILLCFLNLSLPPCLSAGSFQAESKFSKQETPVGGGPSANAVLLAVYSNSLSSSDLKKISGSVARALKDSTPFQFLSSKEMERRLEASSSPDAFLAQVDESIAQARMEYFQFRFEKAASMLQNIIAQASTFDVTPALQSKISDAYLSLGLVFDAQLRPNDAWAAYVNSAASDPARKPDPARYPPNVILKVSKAKTEYLQMKGGVLSLDTDPPGAKVFLEGQEWGTTPSIFKNLSPGAHLIRIQKEGSGEIERKVFVALESEGNKPPPLWVDLNHKGRSSSPAILAHLLSKKVGYETQISEMALLGNRIGVDQIFSARVEQGNLGVELYLVQVDAVQGKEMARAYAKGLNLTDLNRQISPAFSAMLKRKTPATWTDLIAVGEVETDFASEGPKEKKPFYKKWPFFVAIGVVVAGAGAGTAFALKGGGGGSDSGPVTVLSPPP